MAPFTPITAQDVRARRIAPRDAAALPRTLAYLDALDARGRYTLMVWPEHCRIGTWGHLTHAAVQAACDRWEIRRLQPVRHVFKGDNPWTEHYSAFQAEVPDIDDPATALNRALIDELSKAQTLVIAGEAGSHCVRASVEDLLANLPAGASRRVILLTDCMSPVPGFEAEQQAFLERAAAAGVSLKTSTEC